MKVVEKENSRNAKKGTVLYDPSLDNLPIPAAALKKVEEAREFLRKHPIPEHLLRKKNEL